MPESLQVLTLEGIESIIKLEEEVRHENCSCDR